MAMSEATDMHRPIVFRSTLFLVLAVLSFGSVFVSAQTSPKANDPRRINVIYRSWLFTQRGDTVEYAILGEETYDRELWTAIGNQGDVYGYQVTRTKEGKQVGEKLLQRFTNDPAHAERSLANAYERLGYFAERDVETLGDTPLPVLKLQNTSEGALTYSEDVPLGGLVKSADYATGKQVTLVGFKRQAMPAPSERLVELESGKLDVSIRGGGAAKGDKQAPSNEVRDLGAMVREDADTTPPWFKPRGSETTELAPLALVPLVRLAIPKAVARYQMTWEPRDKPEEKVTWELRVQNEGKTADDKWWLSERGEKVEGTPPESLGLVAPLTEKGVARLVDPKTPPPLIEGTYTVYREATEKIVVRGEEFTAMLFAVFEEPEIEREKLENGGERQRVRRVLHRFWIDNDPYRRNGGHVLVRRITIDNTYRQVADERGRVTERSSEETKLTEEISFLRKQVPEETLVQDRVTP